MRTHRQARARREGGFTLLELGIVLGVAAILAAAIAPDLIESMRNRMAEKAANDVAMLHDAARWFFLESGRSAGESRWPGENGVNQCATNFTAQRAISDLLINGYIAGGGAADPTAVPRNFLQNPWGQPYDIDLYTPAAGGAMTPGCLFGIATNLPDALADSFVAFLPQADCNRNGVRPCPDSPGALPPRYVRCCSYVPKPGFEVWRNACPAGASPDANGILRCNP